METGGGGKIAASDRFRESSVTKWRWFQFALFRISRLIFHRSIIKYIRINLTRFHTTWFSLESSSQLARYFFDSGRKNSISLLIHWSSQKSCLSHTHFQLPVVPQECRTCLNILRSTNRLNRTVKRTEDGFLSFDVHTYPRLRATKSTGSTQSLIGP